MNPVHIHEHAGVKILVTSHGRFFQYVFQHNNNFYMQWTLKTVPWWRWLMLPFGFPLFDKNDREKTEDAFVEHAMRSIDKINDPDAVHCIHSVKVEGRDAAKCAQCSESASGLHIPPADMDDEQALGEFMAKNT